MDAALSNGSMWLSVHDGFVSLRIGNMPTAARIAHCRTFGVLLAVYMVHFCCLPSRLAPAFLVALVQGSEAIDNITWIESFASEVASRISVWPRNSRPSSENPGIQTMLIDLLSLMVRLASLVISSRYFSHKY